MRRDSAALPFSFERLIGINQRCGPSSYRSGRDVRDGRNATCPFRPKTASQLRGDAAASIAKRFMLPIEQKVRRNVSDSEQRKLGEQAFLKPMPPMRYGNLCTCLSIAARLK